MMMMVLCYHAVSVAMLKSLVPVTGSGFLALYNNVHHNIGAKRS